VLIDPVKIPPEPTSLSGTGEDQNDGNRQIDWEGRDQRSLDDLVKDLNDHTMHLEGFLPIMRAYVDWIPFFIPMFALITNHCFFAETLTNL